MKDFIYYPVPDLTIDFSILNNHPHLPHQPIPKYLPIDYKFIHFRFLHKVFLDMDFNINFKIYFCFLQFLKTIQFSYQDFYWNQSLLCLEKKNILN